MPIPTKIGNYNTGSGVNFQGDYTVLINGRPASRIGDMYTAHPGFGIDIHPPNPIITGARSIIVGGRPLGYLGVFEALGHNAIPHESDVLIGPI